jgi:hypothetical protein
MAPKRMLGDLGGIEVVPGAYRARIHMHEAMLSTNIRGPRRGSEQQAIDDLLTIRAAAAKHTSRAEGLQAMLLAAERLKAAVTPEVGGVDEVDGEHRALTGPPPMGGTNGGVLKTLCGFCIFAAAIVFLNWQLPRRVGLAHAQATGRRTFKPLARCCLKGARSKSS